MEMVQVLPKVDEFLRRKHGHFIDGAPSQVDLSERLNVLEPSTGHEIAGVANGEIQSVNAAVEAARTTTVQPHASAGRHRDSVEARVEKARSMGASIVTGGSRAQRDGIFYQPTLMVGVNQQNPALQDEIFELCSRAALCIRPGRANSCAIVWRTGARHRFAAHLK